MKTLIIPDIHQNLDFANKCLEEECDKIVFIGDYFDTHLKDGVASFKDTVFWVNKTFNQLGDKATWLFGNHDLAYISYFRNKKAEGYYCSGVTMKKINIFRDDIDPNFVDNLKLATKVDGWTCSHAGFHYRHFMEHLKVDDNVQRLVDEWENDKVSFASAPGHWIMDVGRTRGGYSLVGSPVWMDYDYEFVPIDELSQLVGHTNRYDKQPTRKPGNWSDNYCIDCSQTLYAILEDKRLTFKKV